ncbi:hypothetical protein [Massilia sp. Leaf139]|uniref:hypothetical protein n=1 Tax=Massilia sp. Leaf139 TaxID=1736272 RepID=UPI0012E8B023|nr:hypothetical protein [Massilia sp. Leaf139]
MRYSVSFVWAANEKTAIAGGFVSFGLVARCVNLPLLHRLKAGMAKPKIAGKEGSVAHERSEKGRNDYNPWL